MSRCRIVIADDSSDIRLLLRLALEGEAELELVGEASNGLEAVSQAQALMPDLMLLDLSMPIMDGLEAIPLIQEASSSTVIVVVSGFLNSETKQRVLDAGAVGFLEKGRDFSELVGLIHKVRNDHLGS